MNTYCACDEPEMEEFETNQFMCLKCMKEILRTEEAPEPDDFSEAPDFVEDNEAKYEDRREEAQVSYEGGRL